MIQQTRSLTINITEETYKFICEQAQAKGLAISDYIALCTIAQDDLLHISALTNQLRKLKYQIMTANHLASTEQKDLLSAQERIYNNILSLLYAINNRSIHVN